MKQSYLILIVFGLLFSACGSKNNSATYGVASPPTTVSVSYSDPYAQTVPVSRRVVSTSASINVEVDKVKEAYKKLLTVVKEMNGYVENDNIMEEDGHYYARVKVPSAKLEPTLQKIGTLGEIVSQSIHKQDVTEGLSSDEERLKNLKLFRNRMKALLDKSTQIEDILKIERELNRVQTQIDMIERNLKRLQGSVEMSPIQVRLDEKTIYGPLGYIGHGIWWAVKKLFVIR